MSASKFLAAAVAALGLAAFAPGAARAQQPQIPTLQVCNPTKVTGKAMVPIEARKDATHAGTFHVTIELACDPAAGGYPAGTLEMRIDMTDSIVAGTLAATGFEQVTTTGKHTPTAYLNGRCKAAKVQGCRFWLMLADNKPPTGEGTFDVIGFLVFDATGKRVAYGTGAVREGDIEVVDTAF